MEINQKIDKTVDWLREKVKEAGCKGLVVGVSGGIDSAVVCYLIKKAFPENSIGVIMSINSNPKDREDALKVINGCGIDYIDLHQHLKKKIYTVKQDLEQLTLT